MSFSNWVDEKGSSVYYLDFDEDVTLKAKWDHTITYDAGDLGHFYNGENVYKDVCSEEDTIIDISPCVYTNSYSRAFIGWSLVPNGTADDVINDMAGELSYYKNLTLYAVYTDGYSLTIDANQEGGEISTYYESYKDGDWRSYGKKRSCGKQTLTLTYPLGVRPEDAPYFCTDPIYYREWVVSADDSVIFSNWSSDKAGKDAAYFSNLTLKQDGTDRMYAVWKGYSINLKLAWQNVTALEGEGQSA